MRDLEEEGRVYTVGDTRGFLSRVGEGGRERVETMGDMRAPVSQSLRLWAQVVVLALGMSF